MTENVVKFLNSQFVSTIFGVIVGGFITLFVSKFTEKQRIRMELKVEIWKTLSGDLDKIKESIVNIETEIESAEQNKIDQKCLVEKVDKNVFEIIAPFNRIKSKLVSNVLIIVNQDEILKYFSDDLKKAVTIIFNIKKCNDDIEMGDLKYVVEVLDNEFVRLFALLQNELLKDLYSKKRNKIKKS